MGSGARETTNSGFRVLNNFISQPDPDSLFSPDRVFFFLPFLILNCDLEENSAAL
jgi:hypothetical protein